MAVPAETLSRTAIARDRIDTSLRTHVSGPGGDLASVVDDILDLVTDLGQVRIGCRRDGLALTVRVLDEQEQEIELARGRGRLRSMCARLAVMATVPDELPPIYGGVAYIPPTKNHTHGWTLKMMNTMGEHWFDLAWHGPGG